jgi:exosortase
MTKRGAAISFLWIALLILCWTPVKAVLNLSWNDDRYFQIVAAPFLVTFLIYWERKRIFPGAAWSARAGVPLVALAVSIYLFVQGGSYLPQSSGDDTTRLIPVICAAILMSMAVFILCYGPRSSRAAYFPLGCLLLMVPVPASAMDSITAGLQHGSAAVSLEMLRLAGVPVFAEGMRMSLKGLDIEVAPECSGIRSCVALALVALLAGRVCLRYSWTRLALVVLTIPIAIFKNGIRISVLASLGAYVNPAFLHGPLHHYGGLVFTPLGVALFVALLAGLHRYEARFAAAGPTGPGPLVT